MSTLSHPPAPTIREGTRSSPFLVREMWASLAISAMWIAVAVAAVWGPDFVTTAGGGTNSTTIPSGIAVAMFATIGSWAISKHGLGQRQDDSR